MYMWLCFLNSPLIRAIIQNTRHRKGRAEPWILPKSIAKHLFNYREENLHFQTNLLLISAMAQRRKLIYLGNCFPLICYSLDGSTFVSLYEKKRVGDLENNQQGKVQYSRVCFTLHCFLPAISPSVFPKNKFQNNNSVFQIKIKPKKELWGSINANVPHSGRRLEKDEKSQKRQVF